MKNCDHGLPINEHCDDCMSRLRGDEVRELRQQLAESEDKRFAIAKAIGEVKTSLDIAEIRIEKLQAELEQAESGKKYAIEWCKALQECAELLGMLPGDRIIDVPNVLKAQLAQVQQAEPVVNPILKKGSLFSREEWKSLWQSESDKKTEITPQPAAVAVVLPEARSYPNDDFDTPGEVDSHNSCLAEVRRLNAGTVTTQELARLRADADEHEDARCFLNNILRLHHIEPVDGLDAKIEQVSELLERLRGCEQDAVRYRKALGYYAENKHWYEGMACFGSPTILRDYGDVARAAIQASQSQGE